MTHMSFTGDAVERRAQSAVPTAGIAPGAKVRTLHGERMIETLSTGDWLVDHNGTRIQLASITCSPAPAASLVRIAPDALTDGRGGQRKSPLVVSFQQALMVKGWLARAMFGRDQALVPAFSLVDGELIRPMESAVNMPIFQLRTRTPRLIRIEGLDLLATPAPKDASTAQVS